MRPAQRTKSGPEEIVAAVKAVLEKHSEGDFVTDEECRVLGADVDGVANDRFEEALRAAVYCLDGHNYVDDHCGKPDHRFCIGCGKPIPDEEVTT